jgi:hypothetical protein
MHQRLDSVNLRLRSDWVQWCPSLVLATNLNTTLSNEIGHSAQERALLLAGITQQRHCAQHVLGWTPVPGTQSERSLRILVIRACICVHYN